MAREPSDSRLFLLIVLLALWLMAFLYAFTTFAQAPFDGGGLTSAMSRPAAYLGWQGIAGILAIAIFGVGLSWQKGSGIRRMSRLPILLAVVQSILSFGVLFLFGIF